MILTLTGTFINVIRCGFKVITVNRKRDMVTTSLSFIVEEGNDAKTHGRNTSILLYKNPTSRGNNE